MNNPVGWFEIYVSDMDRAKAFYESVFQVELSVLGNPNASQIQMQAFPADMEKYGSSGALVHMPGFPVGQASILVYFSCADCAVEEARILDAGGKIEKPKFSIGEYGFISIAVDSEGNLFSLHSLK